MFQTTPSTCKRGALKVCWKTVPSPSLRNYAVSEVNPKSCTDFFGFIVKFDHVTSPVKVSEDRDLFFAQPITFATFKIAKEYAQKTLDVVQCSVQFEEDREIVPEHIEILGDLEESLQDVGDFAFKFPFLKEILDVTYKHSLGSDYDL